MQHSATSWNTTGVSYFKAPFRPILPVYLSGKAVPLAVLYIRFILRVPPLIAGNSGFP
jgi:hypothetical protein